MFPTLIKYHPLSAFVAGAILATVLLGHAGRAEAATVAVTNCRDAGPGSLRAAVGSAFSGDTVDLRARRCTILLTTGEIVAPQADLRLLGPGAHALTITSNMQSRFLNHSGTGKLSVERVSIIDSASIQPQYGYAGCIASSGSVELHHARLHHCIAEGVPDPDCGGTGSCYNSDAGAIGASGDVLLSYSTISDSSASGYYSGGGGVYSGGRLTLYRSRLLRNHADSGSAAIAHDEFTAVESLVADNSGYDGGAVQVGDAFGAYGPADVRNSTFTGNSSGVCIALCAGHARIINSTFSQNHGPSEALSATKGASIFNSTIAFNSCSGVYVAGTLRLESTIIAGNTCGDLYLNGSLTGSHNLVGISNTVLPADTLRSDPRLAPLARNGGFTPTHALTDASPAINRGSNVLGLKYDQRGCGFPRTKGASTDIGAFER